MSVRWLRVYFAAVNEFRVNNVLASRQHVYGRSLRFRWFGIYHGVLSVIAFHEKAGRSQVVSLSFLFVTRFFSAELPTVATLPSALFDERVFSLGASWVFSFQPVLPPDCRPSRPIRAGSWARRLTQSPKLGARAWCSLSAQLRGCR